MCWDPVAGFFFPSEILKRCGGKIVMENFPGVYIYRLISWFDRFFFFLISQGTRKWRIFFSSDIM